MSIDPIHIPPDAHSFGGNVCTTAEEVRRFVCYYATAWRQSRFWQAAGHEAWAATMRVKARQFMRHARFRKAHPLKAEEAPLDASAPAAIPQPIRQESTA